MLKASLTIFTAICFITACTTGNLYYTDSFGNRIKACEVEFTGLPSVDKYAVEYALSFCAKTAVKKGHELDEAQKYLLNLDTALPLPPCETRWDHKTAKTMYNAGELTKKHYGYIVAHIDLGLAVVNRCSTTP